jgi:hypothetical protein
VIKSCEHYAFQFHGIAIYDFEGEYHVRHRREFPNGWSDTEKEHYSKVRVVFPITRDCLPILTLYFIYLSLAAKGTSSAGRHGNFVRFVA